MTYLLVMAGIAVAMGLAMVFEKDMRLPALIVGILAMVINTGINSFTIVSPGNTATSVVLGSVDLNSYYGEGVNMVNPAATVEEFNTKRRIVDYGSENAIEVLSKDRIKLTIDATMSFRTTPKYIPYIVQSLGLGHSTTVVAPAARAAFREASSQFDWAEAAITKRDEFAEAVQAEFTKALVSDLLKNKLPEDVANGLYSVGKVQLRKFVLPTKLAAEITERLGTEEREKKQEALTRIATKEALRRKEEGDGIANLLNAALGKKKGSTYAPEAVSIVLGAIADKTRADAMEKAVETGQVKIMIMGGSNTPVAVQTP